jgi:tetratricopeptide (TPR) repeat protein
VALALGLAAACAGCVSSPALKCKTEVAFADFKVREAASSHDLSPPQKEALYEQARVAYHRALKLDPGCREALVGLARLYGATGNDAKAAEAYRAVLKKFPRDAGLWYDLAQYQCRRQDWPAALDCLQRAHGLEPDNRTYSRALGLTLAVAGHPRDGVTTLGEVMGKAEANFVVARLLQRSGKDDQCRPFLEEALRLKPDLGGAREMYAQLGGGPEPAGQPVVTIGFVSEQPAAAPAAGLGFARDDAGARQ